MDYQIVFEKKALDDIKKITRSGKKSDVKKLDQILEELKTHPTSWDYSSGKTWGYMALGGVLGAKAGAAITGKYLIASKGKMAGLASKGKEAQSLITLSKSTAKATSLTYSGVNNIVNSYDSEKGIGWYNI